MRRVTIPKREILSRFFGLYTHLHCPTRQFSQLFANKHCIIECPLRLRGSQRDLLLNHPYGISKETGVSKYVYTQFLSRDPLLFPNCNHDVIWWLVFGKFYSSKAQNCTQIAWRCLSNGDIKLFARFRKFFDECHWEFSIFSTLWSYYNFHRQDEISSVVEKSLSTVTSKNLHTSQCCDYKYSNNSKIYLF